MLSNYEGLNDVEVKASRERSGSNEISPQKGTSFGEELWGNFQDPMIIILCISLLITIVLAFLKYAAWYEGVGIAAAVLIATLVSTYSTYRNDQTFQRLQEEASRIFVKVFRNKQLVTLPINDVVVGDHVLLQPGDKVPADCLVLEGIIEVNQGLLNGEANPVKKSPGNDSGDFTNYDKASAVFRGTTVEDGEGIVIVKEVGDKTVLGKLAMELGQEVIISLKDGSTVRGIRIPDKDSKFVKVVVDNKVVAIDQSRISEINETKQEGPLKEKLNLLAKHIATVAYIGAIVIALVFFFKTAIIDNGYDKTAIIQYFHNIPKALHDFVTAVILAVIVIVVIVPEGLPMMIAMVLARNMKKLLASKVLVRQNVGIETAGSLNLLFCDKTGTITKGQLDPVYFAGFSDDHNDLIRSYEDFNLVPESVRKMLDLSVRENTSCVVNIAADKKTDCLVGGNATEKALAIFVRADCQTALYDDVTIVKHVPFNSTLKYSLCELIIQEDAFTCVKGAPELLLAKSNRYHASDGSIVVVDEGLRNKINDYLDKKADDGYRMIAFTYCQCHPDDDKSLPSDMVMLGFIAIRDDLRPESYGAINRLHGAGIHVVMSTGDKLGTARAIAKDVNLIKHESEKTIESSELANMSDDELKLILPSLRIVSRCTPFDKKRLVRIAQELGLVVGMTGDGVNDSVALKASDIGIGIGSGTEVAKEASHLIILDDNVESIAHAVHYGRSIYRSIQKFINYQLTVNAGAILILLLGPFFGVRLPLTMTQLLWINLIMDTLAALALSGEPPLEKHMLEKPKSRDERIINGDMWSSIFSKGIYIALCSMLFLVYMNSSNSSSIFYQNEIGFLTAFFTFFVYLNLFNLLNSREEGINFISNITKNQGFLWVFSLIFIVQIVLIYFGGAIFRTAPLSLYELSIVVLFAMTIIPFDLIRKGIRNSVAALK